MALSQIAGTPDEKERIWLAICQRLSYSPDKRLEIELYILPLFEKVYEIVQNDLKTSEGYILLLFKIIWDRKKGLKKIFSVLLSPDILKIIFYT